jgi:mRNA interferase RelE/StbE
MASKDPIKYKVLLTKQAARFLSTIPKNYYQIISEHLLEMEDNPFPAGIIKLHGSGNEYRIRVGVYRIL